MNPRSDTLVGAPAQSLGSLFRTAVNPSLEAAAKTSMFLTLLKRDPRPWTGSVPTLSSVCSVRSERKRPRIPNGLQSPSSSSFLPNECHQSVWLPVLFSGASKTRTFLPQPYRDVFTGGPENSTGRRALTATQAMSRVERLSPASTHSLQHHPHAPSSADKRQSS